MSTPSPFRFLGAHLVGSFPVETSEEAFEVIHEHLFAWVRRIPDETGDRAGFIVVMVGPHVFDNEQFELITPSDRFPPITRARLRDDVEPDELKIGSFAYGPLARESYERFARARDQGQLPRDARFLLPIPGPMVATWAVVDDESQAVVLPAVEQRIRESIEEACAAIPHDDLSIQWDLVTERAILEDTATTSSWSREEVLTSITRWSSWVPDDVELGFHMCHGDSRRENLRPGVPVDVVLRGAPVADDTTSFVRATNSVIAAARRPIGFLHLGLPRGWHSERHYRPLADLQLGGDTDLYLGLIHHEDGIEGARERIRNAALALDAFGIGTECGMGRYGSTEKFNNAIAVLRDSCQELNERIPARA